MIQHFLIRFSIRWLATALGLWIAASLLGPARLSIGDDWLTMAGAGFFLAVINMALRPLLVILSFPAIVLSLGLFMLVLNGFLIMLASWLYEPLFVRSFGVAVIAGIIVGLVNYLVTRILEDF